MTAPAYPGYKSACNNCGLCCISGPCAVSVRFGLWQDSRCIALDRQPTANICRVITNPESLNKGLEEFSLEDRALGVGSIGLCDHRAAWSITEARELLAKRNVADEYFGNPGDTYPRCCVVHLPEGKHFATQNEKGGELELVRMIV